jgi:DNA mismatch repair protein MutS2
MDHFTLDKIDFGEVRRILAGYCACSLGKRLACRIGASTRRRVVENWLADTTQMVEVVRDHGLPPLAGAGDIVESLGRAKPGGGATPEDFADIAAALQAADQVRAFLLKLPEELDRVQSLAEPLVDFTAEREAIHAVISPQGGVRDDASPRLVRLRRDIAETSDGIHEVIHGYLRNPEVRKLLQHVNVTLHGDRLVLPVKVEHRGRLPGVVHRSSNTGATVFVEPNASVQMNNHLVDLRDHERMEIDRLLTELAVKVHHRRDEIVRALGALGRLDLLSAKAQFAYQYDMTCPEISDRVVEVFSARHPLLAETVRRQERDGVPPEDRHEVVPIDLRLGSDFDILVVTGSNTGGKTVTLKTLALLAAMTQAGLHIPARRGARMPIFRDVLLDIGDEQSLEQSLSTFGGHIQRLKHILAKARPDSLVLLDELGSGTDPDEGGAIGQAILDELQRKGCLAMVTTHISVLKAYAMNHDRVDNASVEFDTKTLRPTYVVRIGTAGESHAITVASKLGLPKRLIHDARRHLGTRGGQLRKALRKTGAARQEAETARAEAAAAAVDAEFKAQDLEAQKADLHKLKTDFANWLARLSELKPGDEVYVPSARQTGRLVRLELHKQVALVALDRMEMEVPLTQLMPDIGQQGIRRHLDTLREQTEQRHRHAEQVLREAEQRLQDAREVEERNRRRAKQFDRWLGNIARVKPGDTVPVARKPGRAKVLSVDFPALKAVVEIDKQRTELSLQDLFPQTGPFSPEAVEQNNAKPSRGKTRDIGKANLDRPIPRRDGDNASEKNRRLVLQTPPGRQVYVIPFQRLATLVRLEPERDQAVVQAGAFEMQVPLSDLEPAR